MRCNDRAGEYQLNQAWLYFVKPTKTDGYGWDIGGRIDVVYGTDWRFGQCYGLETSIDDPNSFYGLVLPQFYGEVAVNDLTVKMGHFATFTSLELIPAPLNFFYSHALLACPYFDPVLVTGMQADYKLNDNWTAVGGFNNGSMMFEDPTDTYNFLGGVKRASDDKRSNLSVMVDAGPQVGFTGVHDRTNVIAVYTYQLTERFMYGSQYTAGIEKHGSVIHPGHDASWYGTEQLFTYKLNDKWSAGSAIRMGPRQRRLARRRHRQRAVDRPRLGRQARLRRRLQRSEPGTELASASEHRLSSRSPLGLVRRCGQRRRSASLRQSHEARAVHGRLRFDCDVLTCEKGRKSVGFSRNGRRFTAAISARRFAHLRPQKNRT